MTWTRATVPLSLAPGAERARYLLLTDADGVTTHQAYPTEQGKGWPVVVKRHEPVNWWRAYWMSELEAILSAQSLPPVSDTDVAWLMGPTKS